MLPKPKVYSLKVSGIKCTNCAGKIKTGLDQLLQQEHSKVSVNIMQETVTISTSSPKDLITLVMSKLEQIGYPVIKQPLLLDSGDAIQRLLTVKVKQDSTTEKIEGNIKNDLIGISSLNRVHQEDFMKFRLSYNPDIVKGKQIADYFERHDPNYVIVNDRVESFKHSPKNQNKQNSLRKTLILCTFFLVFNMFLPFTGKWYDQLITIPRKMKILSFSVLLNLSLSAYVFIKYTKPIVKRAFKNYRQFGSTDMQTLVSLGCLSAFALCGLFFIKYGLQIINNQFSLAHKAVMDINDALTSASIIVLVVNVGKYMEQKVKRKIEVMTEEIFPQSTLFTNMKVQFIELQNRLLKIKGRKLYDFTLLEKGDIISLNSLHNSRLLVDIILISGKIRAQQSTTSGSDEILEFKKGDRIESGALIYPKIQDTPQQCLATVQNVFQKSMLIQIGTQIKFSQNQENDQVHGIQAVCKSIANIFVKAVVALSLVTMIVWTILIKTQLVKMDQFCALCWIVQRGIGVLVASCPCALGLAVPSVIAIVLNLATKSGILIKNNGVFQKMKITKKISFDKTGTLFTRIEKIQQYHILSTQIPQSQIWQIVALIERQIRHPLAEILYKQAIEKCKIEGTNFSFILTSPKIVVQKEGLMAEIRNKKTGRIKKILIGNKGILSKNGVQSPHYQKITNASTQIFLCVDNEVMLVMRLNTHSNLRPEALQVIRSIMAEGEQVHILSGDSKESVINLGNLLNIREEFLHPEHSSFMKMEWIKKVQQSDLEGVMMIGDGLNDIPCLQQAAIGVSINAKSQLNINAADIVVLDDNLYKILALIRMLKKGNLFININLFWAFAYNITVMPIVAGVFYKWNFWVSPIWSSIAMSLSSVIVVSISHLLSFLKFDESVKNGKGVYKEKKAEQESLSNSRVGIKGDKKSKKQAKYLELMERTLYLIRNDSFDQN